MPDIQKLRAMMLKLNASGYDPKLFYPAIRLHNYTQSQGLTIAKAERILEIFQEYAFKKNYNISELIDAIIEAFNIAARWGTDLEHLDQHVHNTGMVVQANEALIRKQKNDIEILPYKYNIKLAELQEYLSNKPTFQKLMKMVIESGIKDRRISLLEDQNGKLNTQVLERDKELERLNQLLSQQSKKNDGCYIDPHQEVENFDSTDCFVEDIIDAEDNNDFL